MFSAMRWGLFLVLTVKMSIVTTFLLDYTRTTDPRDSRILNKFWTSTGLSPEPGEAKHYLLSKDMEMNLALLGAVPHKGLTHVRIHWLLDLVTNSPNSNGTTIPTNYNFTDLDRLLNILHQNDLLPGFELMGSPSNLRNLFTQITEWKKFLSILIDRYIEMFGEAYVKAWRFESLNEPDLQQYNLWNLTLPQYIDYVQASAMILNKYNLKLWGPAGLFKTAKQHPRCWGLLKACNDGTCPISVLSFHKKGDARASQIVNGSESLLQQFRSKFPNLGRLPIANNEADVLTGWWKSEKWRADVRYAAAVVQTIIGFVDLEHRRGIQLAAISNDNGFLSYSPYYWTQRTLFARMQMNNSQSSHIQLLNKPVYSAMNLLSLLSTNINYLLYEPGEPGFCAIATFEDSQISILLTIAHDAVTTKARHKKFQVNTKIKLPQLAEARQGIVYLLDNRVTNPAKIWRKAGSPPFPTKPLQHRMRRHGGIHELENVTVAPSQRYIDLALTLHIPSVVLINICDCTQPKLGPVSQLRYINVTENEIILIWKNHHIGSRCLLTYEVAFRKHGSNEFQEISSHYSFVNSFQFDGCIPPIAGDGSCCRMESDIKGEYKVTPIHYCHKKGRPATITVY